MLKLFNIFFTGIIQMIYQTIKNFVDLETLRDINQELTDDAKWRFRKTFFRFNLLTELKDFDEFDESTYYQNQNVLDQIAPHWQKVYKSISDLAGEDFNIMRFVVGGQVAGQSLHKHADLNPEFPGDCRTFLVYLNDWYPESGAGLTVFEDKDFYHEEHPESGKLVEFNSKTPHYTTSHTVSDWFRFIFVVHGAYKQK